MTKINLIVGNPVAHSISPSTHNSWYKELGIDIQFWFGAAKVEQEISGEIILTMKTLNINGLAVTHPYKEIIIPQLDKLDKVAEIIGAVNTVINVDGICTGYNTDWLGILMPIANLFAVKELDINNPKEFLKNKKVVILGAGGAAKAASYAVLQAGGELAILNRTIEKAEKIKENLVKNFPQSKINIGSLDDKVKIEMADIIINCTSVGLLDSENCPIDTKSLNSNQIVFETIYNPAETKLIQEAKKLECKMILGKEMFLFQAKFQFELMTGLTKTI